jgi:glutaredoxin 3
MSSQSNLQGNAENQAAPNQERQGDDQLTKVEIYTWRFCPYCIRAKGLLDRKGVIYSEYLIDGDDTARQAMARRAEGRSSLPQIFINNQPIGGCDNLMELDQAGLLDQLLGVGA